MIESNGSDGEILLVEDNPNDAELVIRALKRNGLRAHVSHVEDGVQAIEFLLGTGTHAARAGAPLPKLVMLDCKLPKLTGVEVLRQIRAEPKLAHVITVMLTSSKEERDIADAYRHGVNSYVVKPVEFEEFVDTVGRIGQYWLRFNQNSPPA
jgi:two-component system, response regulator